MRSVLLLFALCLSPLCSRAQPTVDQCTNTGPVNPLTGENLFAGSLTSGDLRICMSEEIQCCTQGVENELGMLLQRALRDNVTLGTGLYQMRSLFAELADAVTDIATQVRDNYLRPIMRNTVTPPDNAEYNTQVELMLSSYNNLVFQTQTTDLAVAFDTFLNSGVVQFELRDVLAANPTDEQRQCLMQAVFDLLFDTTNSQRQQFTSALQNIAEAFSVIIQANNSLSDLYSRIEGFSISSSCRDIWTRQYACPKCLAVNAPVCLPRCDEILIGCFSPLHQAIVQLNSLIMFATSISVNLLQLPGTLVSNLNIASIPDLYLAVFDRARNVSSTDTFDTFMGCGITARKRSTDNLVRSKRARGSYTFMALDSGTLSRMENATVKLYGMSSSNLGSDRQQLCNILEANGSTNCLVDGVIDVDGYSSNFTNQFDISNQTSNPAGSFDTEQLLDQARSLPYVISSLLTRSEAEALYSTVLPDSTPPNTDFLAPTSSPTSPGGASSVTSLSLSAVLLATIIALL